MVSGGPTENEHEIETRAMRETIVTQQRELERMRVENARYQSTLARTQESLAIEIEERGRLVTTIARAQSMKVPPDHEWPRFPENTFVRILSTSSPSGMIDIAIGEHDSVDVVAKRIVDAVMTAKRTSKR